MDTNNILPDPRLRSFIDYYSYVEFDAPDTGAGVRDHLCVPTSKRLIVIYLNGKIEVTRPGNLITPNSGAVVVGQHFNPVRINHNGCSRIFSIVFNATGLYRLLCSPLHEFDNSCIELENILGSQAAEFTERLQNLISTDELKEHTDHFFLSRLYKLTPEIPVDRLLATMTPGQTVAALSELANISIRQFERVCHQRLGMSPKRYLRLRRFCMAYKMKEQHPDKSWLDITFAMGYYDQMHFIRDWKCFADATPIFTENEIYQVAPLRKF